jgi:LCP family protein required for cell wall assembly
VTEDELRAVFARHEEPVTADLSPLRGAIDREAGRRRTRRGVLRTTGVAISVVLLAAVSPIGYDLLRLLPDTPARPAASTAAPAPMNLLLLGVDRRPGQSVVARADAVVIVHIPASRDRAFLISVPRDTRVSIPAHPRSGSTATTGKLNTAFALGAGNGAGIAGGTDLTALTLRRLTGVAFDGAAVLEMDGLRRVTDALGGVPLCVDRRVTSMHTRRVFEPGCRRFTGDEAIDYLRQRIGLPNGVLDRDRHLQQFLKALIAEAGRVNLLADPARLLQIMNAAGSALTIDTGGRETADLIREFTGLSTSEVRLLRVPVRLTPGPVPGTSSDFEPAEPLAGALFDALRRDTLTALATAHPELTGA